MSILKTVLSNPNQPYAQCHASVSGTVIKQYDESKDKLKKHRNLVNALIGIKANSGFTTNIVKLEGVLIHEKVVDIDDITEADKFYTTLYKRVQVYEKMYSLVDVEYQKVTVLETTPDGVLCETTPVVIRLYKNDVLEVLEVISVSLGGNPAESTKLSTRAILSLNGVLNDDVEISQSVRLTSTTYKSKGAFDNEPEFQAISFSMPDFQALAIQTLQNIESCSDGVITSGDHCKGCILKKDCAQYKGLQSVEIANSEQFLACVHTSVQLLNPLQISTLLKLEATYNDAFVRLKQYAFEQLEAGVVIPDYYLSKGKKSSKWTLADEEVAKKLKNMRFKNEVIFPNKLISVAKARELKLTESQTKNLEKMIESKTGLPLLKLQDSKNDPF